MAEHDEQQNESPDVAALRRAAELAGATYGEGPFGGLVFCADESNRQLARIATALERIADTCDEVTALIAMEVNEELHGAG